MGVVFLLFCTSHVKADNAAMQCYLFLPMDLDETWKQCDEFYMLFPKPEDQLFQMSDWGDSGGAKYKSKYGVQLRYVADDEEVQRMAKKSAEEGNYDWLEGLEDNMVGVWTAINPKGQAFGYHYTTELVESITPPDTLYMKLACGKTLEVQTECQNRQFGFEWAETYWKGSFCGFTGECEEGSSCVQINPYIFKCMEDTEIAEKQIEEKSVVKQGETPKTYPWDNCYWSRKCAVEGYQCFRNKRWTQYARCLPAGTCPKARGRDRLKSTWGVDDPSQLTPQTVQRRLLSHPEKTGLTGPWSPKVRGEEKRRRLRECLHDNVEAWSLGDAFDSLESAFGPSSHVNMVSKIAKGDCSEHFDTNDPMGGSQGEKETGTQTNGGSKQPLRGFDFEDAMKGDFFKTHEMDLQLDDFVGWDWLDQKMWQENGGHEGWDCDRPWGPVATKEDGADDVWECRKKANDVGYNPWEVCPESKSERNRRRVRRLQKEDPDRHRRLQSMSFDNIELATAFGNAALTTAEADALAELPAPPEAKEDKPCAYELEREWAPEKIVGWELVCAPLYIFAPVLESGPGFIMSPKANWGPVVAFGPEVYLGTAWSGAPKVNLGFELAAAPEIVYAPYIVNGVEIIMAPEVVVIPYILYGTEVVLTPTTHAPDILEDVWYERTEFPPSKLKRYADRGVFQGKGKPIQKDVKPVYEGKYAVKPYEMNEGIDEGASPDMEGEAAEEEESLSGQFIEKSTTTTTTTTTTKPSYDIKGGIEAFKSYDYSKEDGKRVGPPGGGSMAEAEGGGESPVTEAEGRPCKFKKGEFCLDEYGGEGGGEGGGVVSGRGPRQPNDYVTWLYDDKLNFDQLVIDVRNTEIPPAPIPPKLAESLGIRKNPRLGAFFTVEAKNEVECSQYELDANGQRNGKIHVFKVLPRDLRVLAGKLEPGCVFPYPSDIIRDIPNLPKAAYPAIAAMEGLENLLPPQMKIAINSIFSFGAVLAGGRLPDPISWLESFQQETNPEGNKMEAKNSERQADGSVNWLKAFDIAAKNTPAEVIKTLPSFLKNGTRFTDSFRMMQEGLKGKGPLLSPDWLDGALKDFDKTMKTIPSMFG